MSQPSGTPHPSIQQPPAHDLPPHQRHPAGPPPGAASPPPHIDNAKPRIYEVFNAPARPDNANALPEGMSQNTAGSRPEKLSITEAAKMVKLEDFKTIHQKPCVRESLLAGIAGGFGVGGLRLIFGTPLVKACNWAVGSFCFIGVGAYEFNLQKRRMEKAAMQRAVEIMDRKKMEKEAERDEKRKERRRRHEEEERRKEEESRSKSWKFW